jgi:hypothetical protein
MLKTPFKNYALTSHRSALAKPFSTALSSDCLSVMGFRISTRGVVDKRLSVLLDERLELG